MKKDGFTLIEVLVVIVILCTIGVSSMGLISYALENDKEKQIERLKTNIEASTEIYVNMNSELSSSIYSGGSTCITLYSLLSKGLIKDNLINPLTNVKIDYNRCVNVSLNKDRTINYLFK
ncbi:MAG: type II secretion system protein [Bacilli bacterium]